MTAVPYAAPAMPGPVVRPAIPESRVRNRADHYWPRIEAATGRKKEREAKDYVAALLAGQPPEVIEEAVAAVEKVVGVTYERV